MIGKGSYGCVSKAKCRFTGKLVALKVMKNQTKTEYEIIKLLREIQLLRKLDDTYQRIVGDNGQQTQSTNLFVPVLLDIICPIRRRAKGLESYKSENMDNDYELYDLSQICLVMEFVETDLDQLLKNKINFTEHHLKKIVYNTLCALAYLHINNVMHRDLKPANILLSAECDVKICDLGLSRCMP